MLFSLYDNNTITHSNTALKFYYILWHSFKLNKFLENVHFLSADSSVDLTFNTWDICYSSSVASADTKISLWAEDKFSSEKFGATLLWPIEFAIPRGAGRLVLMGRPRAQSVAGAWIDK